MLFNSLVFLLIFAPFAFGLLVVMRRLGHTWALSWLAFASLAFYGWTDPRSLPLLLLSIAINYKLGVAIVAFGAREKNRIGIEGELSKRKLLLWLGLIFNLGFLGYYKYAGLLVDSVMTLGGIGFEFNVPILPVGISFFTFTQIAFLVDAYAGKVQDVHPVRYLLFVSYFPHLIAGPILHHGQMMPQFAKPSFGRMLAGDVLEGSAIFLIGLFKKVVLADGVSQFVSPVFLAAGSTDGLRFEDAWIGALAYTFQLYFDFSGYSDMAIGLAKMMGLVLPENFNSPYKAKSISDFWRRWHISLSSFLRDYLYIPLGGNRSGKSRRNINLLITMLLGGLWHGASWTFLVWGGLHGVYLIVNNFWQTLSRENSWLRSRFLAPFYQLLTLTAVVVGWVFFRAESFGAAFTLLDAMFGLATASTHKMAFDQSVAWLWICLSGLLAIMMPNTLQLRHAALRAASSIGGRRRELLGVFFGGMIFVAVLMLTAIAESTAGRSPFIYLNF